MTAATSKQEAWNKANEIFPTDYDQDMGSSHQPTVNIWIEEPVQEPAASDEDTKASVADRGGRLPDQRLKYDAGLAQLRMQQELEQRGRKTARA